MARLVLDDWLEEVRRRLKARRRCMEAIKFMLHDEGALTSTEIALSLGCEREEVAAACIGLMRWGEVTYSDGKWRLLRWEERR